MKSEKDWAAESDFRSLSEAEEVRSDKKRYSSALKAGQTIVRKKNEEVNAMKKIVKRKSPMKRKSSPKRKTSTRRKK